MAEIGLSQSKDLRVKEISHLPREQNIQHNMEQGNDLKSSGSGCGL